jgi:hypothetical protein
MLRAFFTSLPLLEVLLCLEEKLITHQSPLQNKVLLV